MPVLTSGAKVVQLRLQRPVEESTFQSTSLTSSHTRRNNPVKNSWYRGKEVGFKYLQVLKQTSGVANSETNSTTDRDHVKFLHTLQDIGNERDSKVIIIEN